MPLLRVVIGVATVLLAVRSIAGDFNLSQSDDDDDDSNDAGTDIFIAGGVIFGLSILGELVALPLAGEDRSDRPAVSIAPTLLDDASGRPAAGVVLVVGF